MCLLVSLTEKVGKVFSFSLGREGTRGEMCDLRKGREEYMKE